MLMLLLQAGQATPEVQQFVDELQKDLDHAPSFLSLVFSWHNRVTDYAWKLPYNLCTITDRVVCSFTIFSDQHRHSNHGADSVCPITLPQHSIKHVTGRPWLGNWLHISGCLP